MKRPYQIESKRAVKRLEEMAADGNPAVQMVLPMAEMVGWLREGVGELIRRAGLHMIELLIGWKKKSGIWWVSATGRCRSGPPSGGAQSAGTAS